MLDIAVFEAMVAEGASAQVLLSALKVMLADEQKRLADRRAKDAARQRRKRVTRSHAESRGLVRDPPSLSPLDSKTLNPSDLQILESTMTLSEKKAKRGSRLPPDWQPSDSDRSFALACGLDPDKTVAEFRDYWVAVPGSRGVKLDWSATWRNRCRTIGKPAAMPADGGVDERARAEHFAALAARDANLRQGRFNGHDF